MFLADAFRGEYGISRGAYLSAKAGEIEPEKNAGSVHRKQAVALGILGAQAGLV